MTVYDAQSDGIRREYVGDPAQLAFLKAGVNRALEVIGADGSPSNETVNILKAARGAFLAEYYTGDGYNEDLDLAFARTMAGSSQEKICAITSALKATLG